MKYPAPKKFEELLSKKPNEEVFGLSFVPTFGMGEDILDTLMGVPGYKNNPYTDCVRNVIIAEMKRLGDSLKCIMEIGVEQAITPYRNAKERGPSLSRTLIDHKPKDACYVGIDKEDKRFWSEPENNVHITKADSGEREKVHKFLDGLEIDKIDLLHIDGYHSIKHTINDWRYVERLSDHGVVIIHDTNYHPGPWAIFEAIDEKIFEKERFCFDSDYGCGVARRIQWQNE